MSELLLDTCAIIWSGTGANIAAAAAKEINDQRAKGQPTYVSPFSAWELGVLVSRGRLRLTCPPADWFEDFVRKGSLSLAPLGVRVLADSASLPGTPPADPADRIIIATARAKNLTIVTRDRKILAYADEGYVRALAC